MEIYRRRYDVGPSKLIAGVAFYGIKQVSSGGKWKNGGSLDYTTIRNTYLKNPEYVCVYDETAQVPYLISRKDGVFISYDNPRSIIAKAKYAKENNLAGLMYWQNGADRTGELLQALKEGMKQ